MTQVSCSELYLVNPHSPLRYAENGKASPPFALKNLKIWDESSTAIAIPATFDYGAPIVLKFRCPSDPSLKQWRDITTFAVTGVPQPPNTSNGWTYTLLASKSVTHDDHTYVDLTVQISSPLIACPWGFKGEINWTFTTTDKSGDPVPFSQSIPLELYGVVKDIAPYYAQERIPVEFLELLVLPVTKNPAGQNPITSLSEWQTWVVGKCFASAMDKTTDLDNQPMHSYMYETVNGQCKFVCGEKQAIFDLDGWLQQRLNKEWNKINCYDQSALTQVALELGTPYYYDGPDGQPLYDSKQQRLQSVGRIWKSAFGFIPTADLVGWGHTNSPFFQKDPTKMIVAAQSPDRTLFKNHSWTYIRCGETDTASDFLAVDACAGPAKGTTSLLTYLTSNIDVERTKNFDADDYVNTDDHKNWSEEYKAKWTAWNPLEFEPWYGILSTKVQVAKPKYEHKKVSVEISSLFPELAPQPDPATINRVDVDPFELLLQAIVILDLTLVPNPNNDIVEVSSGGSVVRQIAALADGSHIGMKVMICSDFVNALSNVASDMQTMTGFLSTIFDVSGRDSSASTLNIYPTEAGATAVMVYNNIYVLLQGSGSIGDKKIQKIVAHMSDYLVKFNPYEFVSKKWTDSGVVCNVEQTVNDIFLMQIIAPDCAKVDVKFTNGLIMTLDEPKLEEHTKDLWTVPCLPLAEGKETAVVSYALKTTYYTLSGDKAIQVNAAPAPTPS